MHATIKVFVCSLQKSSYFSCFNKTDSKVISRCPASSSSAFNMMVALTRFFLPWVPHIWMSGTNPLQTPRAWFWGTHMWAISAALLADGVSRTVGSVLVFGPPLHRGIVRRSLRQSSWDGCSEAKDDGLLVSCQLMECVLIWVVSFSLAVEDGFLFSMDKSFDFSVGQMRWGLLFSLPSFASWSAISFPRMPVCAGIHWRTTWVVWARVLMFSVSFFCVVSGSSDMRACRADNESVRKTAFLGFSSHEDVQLELRYHHIKFHRDQMESVQESETNRFCLVLIMWPPGKVKVSESSTKW